MGSNSIKWLKQFKEILDNNPDILDGELFRAFPELKGSPNRMSAALLYWQYEIVADEFKKVSAWRRFINKLLNGIRGFR